MGEVEIQLMSNSPIAQAANRFFDLTTDLPSIGLYGRNGKVQSRSRFRNGVRTASIS